MLKKSLNLFAKRILTNQGIHGVKYERIYKSIFWNSNEKHNSDNENNKQKMNINYKNQFQESFLNQSNIQRKVKQIKQTGTVEPQNLKQRMNRQKKHDFMASFTIPQINTKIQQFRKKTNTENIFAFEDVTVQEKPTILQVTGYEQNFIQVDGFPYPPSVILTPNQIFVLQARNSRDLNISHFQILRFIKPAPQYVIIGVPKALQIKDQLRNQIMKLHTNVDFIQVFQAISQFNITSGNEVDVMAFIMLT